MARVHTTNGLTYVAAMLVTMAAAHVCAGCVAENDPGPSLNPQPLPPEPPPSANDDRNAEQAPGAGAFGADASDGGSCSSDAGCDGSGCSDGH